MLFKVWAALRLAGSSLPDEVSTVISAASITWRGYDDENGPRIAVALGGPLRGMFYYDRDEAERRIAARWPWLDREQLRRAADYLDARVHVECATKKPRSKKNWVLDF